MESSLLFNRASLILLVSSLLLGWVAWSPRTLSEYEVATDAAMSDEDVKKYVFSIKDSLRAGKQVKLSEVGMNRFISGAITMNHSFAFKPWVQTNGLFVDISKGHVSFCLERDVVGRKQQSEVVYSVYRRGDSIKSQGFGFRPAGGKLGKLKLPNTMAYGLSGWHKDLFKSMSPAFSEITPFLGGIEARDGELVLIPKV